MHDFWHKPSGIGINPSPTQEKNASLSFVGAGFIDARREPKAASENYFRFLI